MNIKKEEEYKWASNIYKITEICFSKIPQKKKLTKFSKNLQVAPKCSRLNK